MSITTIENLSNEFFYEIFEYLDGCEIFQAFSNLNYRFQQLINSSSVLLKINLDCSTTNELRMNIYKQLLNENKHQILSFRIKSLRQKSEFLSSFSIDSSLHRLESLALRKIQPMILLSLLQKLTSLPRLFTLFIDMQWMLNDLSEVYRLIFTLPKLKYIKCLADDTTRCASLPVATDEQFSIIEHLIIHHSCPFNELCTLMSYTPQLRHLDMTDLSEGYSQDEIILPVTFPNLTHLSIEMVSIPFDEFEMFIIDTECNLKALRMNDISDDRDYLDADRWEELIVNYLPELKEFYFQYHQAIDPESGWLTDFEPPNQFNSLFWNERKWVLEVEMDSFDYLYSIRSYKDTWYDVDSPDEIADVTRLILTGLPHNDHMMELHFIIRDLLMFTQIYHLEISKQTIGSDLLINYIHNLPAIDTLKVCSLQLSSTRHSFMDAKNLRLVSNKNKITKVYLEHMNDIEDVYFLMKLCPRMTYLKIDFIDNMDMELFVKDILKKIKNDSNQYLRLLHIHVPTAGDKMIQNLKEMINYEKLLRDFTVQRVVDDIHLEWS